MTRHRNGTLLLDLARRFLLLALLGAATWVRGGVDVPDLEPHTLILDLVALVYGLVIEKLYELPHVTP